MPPPASRYVARDSTIDMPPRATKPPSTLSHAPSRMNSTSVTNATGICCRHAA
jgi:hypothetical protein